MPEGEEMFKYHGYSGNCPKPPLKSTPSTEKGNLWGIRQKVKDCIPDGTEKMAEKATDEIMEIIRANFIPLSELEEAVQGAKERAWAIEENFKRGDCIGILVDLLTHLKTKTK